MRIGLLADIHANLPALDSALRMLKSVGVDAIVAAGDTIGYGPFPNECIDVVRSSVDVCIAGNHELFLLEAPGEARYGRLAQQSLLWTKEQLGQHQWDWLYHLRRHGQLGNVVVAHGSLADPHEYVVRPRQLADQLTLLRRHHPDAEALVLGHTHSPAYREEGQRASLAPLRHRRFRRRVVINPGSVGQSRQWENFPRARFAVLDFAAREAHWYAIPYEHTQTLRALAAAGLSTAGIHFRPTALVAMARLARRTTDLRWQSQSESRRGET